MNAHTLQRKCKPGFELPEKSEPRLHKAQYKSQYYGSERLRDLHIRHRKTQTGHIPDWKINELHSRLENKRTVKHV